MTKRVVIAEKPSVGMSIAAVLGVKDRKEGYLEGRDTIVSWGFGHLAELANADAYDEKYAKWNHRDLPIIPADWKYKIPFQPTLAKCLRCRSPQARQCCSRQSFSRPSAW